MERNQVGEIQSRRLKELAIYIAAFSGPLAGNAVLALVGTLADEWAVSETAILVSIPAFMVPFAAIQLFSGPVAEKYERRTTVTVGLLVYIAGSLVCAASTSLLPFLLARFIQGVGYAFVNPVLVAVLSDVAGASRQGTTMGFYGSWTSAGVASGPFLAGALAEVNWRLAFVVIAALAAFVLLLFRALFERTAVSGPRVPVRAALTRLASVFSNRDVALLSGAGFLAFFAFGGVISFVSVYLASPTFDLDASEIGLVISLSGLVGIFTSPIAGRSVDKIGPRCCVTVGFLITSGMAIALSQAGSYTHFLLLLPVMGAGTGFIWSSLLTMLMRVDPLIKATSSSVFNSARFTGFAVSPVLLTPLYGASGFDVVVVACGVLGLVALGLVLSSRRSLDKR